MRRDEKLLEIVPDNPNHPYDMHDVIRCITDHGGFLEVHAGFAGNILTGFARIGGHPVGIIANQPAVLAGVLGARAGEVWLKDEEAVVLAAHVPAAAPIRSSPPSRPPSRSSHSRAGHSGRRCPPGWPRNPSPSG